MEPSLVLIQNCGAIKESHAFLRLSLQISFYPLLQRNVIVHNDNILEQTRKTIQFSAHYCCHIRSRCQSSVGIHLSLAPRGIMICGTRFRWNRGNVAVQNGGTCYQSMCINRMDAYQKSLRKRRRKKRQQYDEE